MEQYHRETDRDWHSLQKKIEAWRKLPEAKILYDDVLRAFQTMRLKGEMTPMVRREYERIVQKPQDTYIQPVTHIEDQQQKCMDVKESDLCQLTLVMLPEAYRPKVVSRASILVGILSFLTSVDLVKYSQWCKDNVCHCCLPQLERLWCQMCVEDMRRVMDQIVTMSQSLCTKQKEHYQQLIRRISLKASLAALIKDRIVLYNELLFLRIKINLPL